MRSQPRRPRASRTVSPPPSLDARRATRLSTPALAAHVTLWGCVALTGAAVPTGDVHAAAAAPGAQGERQFAIAAGPLARALNQFAAAAGVQVSVDAALTAGRTSPGVQGAHSVSSGFAALLAGTGLDAVRRAAGEYTLRQAPAPAGAPGQAALLAPVTVTGAVDGSELTDGLASYAARETSVATGMPLSLRETPQSVSVLTRQRLDDQSLTNLGDALAQTTGIVYQAVGTPVGGRAPLLARGYPVNNYQIDGLTVSPDAWSFGGGLEGSNSMDTAIYDSITVLRGATGLQTGAGDPSATISLTRKRPTHELRGAVTQSFGTWSQHRTMADVGGPLNEAGTLRARVVGAYDAGNSWVDRYKYDKRVGYGVIEADIAKNTMLSVFVEHNRDHADGSGPYTGMDVTFSDGTPSPFGRGVNGMTDWSRFQKDYTSTTLMLDHAFNDDWRAKLAYNYSDFEGRIRFGNAVGQADPNGFTDLMVRNFHIRNRSKALQLKVDGQFSLWGRRHDLVLGLMNSETPSHYVNGFTNRAFASVQTIGWTGQFPEPDWDNLQRPAGRFVTRQTATWLATRLRPIEDVSVIGGLRWSRWSTRATSALGEVTDDRTENGVITPYIGLVYDFTQNLSAYASYTTIFNPQSNLGLDGRPLDPEKGSNREVGLKGDWWGGRLYASAALFEVRKDNLALELPNQFTPNGDQAYIAANGTKGRGWELEVAGEILPGWNVQGGYTRMVTKDADGLRLHGDQPKHLLKVFTTWTPQAFSRLTVGGGAVWESAIHATWVEPDQRDAYTQRGHVVANLMGRYAFTPQLDLTLNVNNVFDKVYRTDPAQHSYGSPRQFLATLKYTF